MNTLPKSLVHNPLFHLAMLILGFFVILAPVLSSSWFLVDDIGQRNHIRHTLGTSAFLTHDFVGFVRPTKNILFLLFDMLSANHIWPARLLSILIGIFSLLSIYYMLKSLTQSHHRAVLTTALWATAPTLVSSTAWFSAVNIQFMTATVAWCVTFHHKQAEKHIPTARGCMLYTALIALALLSYEGAVCIALLVPLIDLVLFPDNFKRKRSLINYALGIALTSGYITFRLLNNETVSIIGFFNATSSPQAALAAAWFTLDHLSVWLWPFGRQALMGAYSHGEVANTLLLIAWGSLLGGAFLAWINRKRTPYLSLGCLWFLIGFLPMSNILGFKNGPYGDYYLTLASVGIAIALADIILSLWQHKRNRLAQVVIAILVIWRAAASVEAINWTTRWTRPAVMLETNIRNRPNAYRPYLILARIQIQEHNNLEAAEDLVNQIRQRYPDLSDTLPLLAIIAQRRDQIDQAIAYCKQYRQRRPNDIWALAFSGFIEEEYRNNPSLARRFYKQAMAQLPWTTDSVFAANRMAYLEATSGNLDEAIMLWRKSVTINPQDGQVHQNLATAYLQSGQPAKASYHQQQSKIYR